MAKNLILAQIWLPQNFVSLIFTLFCYLNYMLDIAVSHQCMQFQRKLINQTWENGKKTQKTTTKKTNSGPNFGSLG